MVILEQLETSGSEIHNSKSLRRSVRRKCGATEWLPESFGKLSVKNEALIMDHHECETLHS